MQDLQFKVTAPVKAGATVTAKNNDTVEHTVTADDGSFNVTVEPGKTATFTAPNSAGDYKFHCNIHSQMHGTLTVQ
jgi:plastocyanin